MSSATAQISFLDPIFVDCFAGGGGWSTGAELALGRVMDIAINHDPDAVLMHKTNHPFTKHYCENILEVTPKTVVEGRHVAWAHFSPDCTHHSRAKGGKPVDKKIRGLAWIVLRWAAHVAPDVISLENVEEFLQWGPVRKGKAVKSKAGQTFAKWKSQLEGTGYKVEYRVLVASDYGAPTSRKRLFVLARRDGKPIVWPEATHGDPNTDEVKNGKLLRWRTAADIIDWSRPAPSIFASREEIKKVFGLSAVRPLADTTMRRTIRGVDKYVIKADDPYVIPMNEDNISRLISPSIVTANHTGGFHGQDIETPAQTITAKHGYGVTQPVLAPVMMSNNENAVGSAPEEPIGTITTGGHKIAILPVITALAQTGGGDRCRSVESQIHTTVSKAETLVTAPTLIQYHGEKNGNVRAREPERPVMTVDTSNRHAIAVAAMTKYYGNSNHGQDVCGPLHTITTKDREALIKTNIIKMKGQNIGQDVDTPLQTIMAGGTHFGAITTKIVKIGTGTYLNHWPEIRDLLNKHCGYELADDEVLLLCIGDTRYYIADIGLRMLAPIELYAANGFPNDYIIDRDYTGKTYVKSKQVARCGNAVPPPFAYALVRANAPEYCNKKRIQTMEELNELVAV